jgi:uncharacterized membrane protein YeiH
MARSAPQRASWWSTNDVVFYPGRTGRRRVVKRRADGRGDARRLRYEPMDVPEGFNATLILVLNLAGTFVFGLSGGLAAVRAKLDLFVVLSAVVGLAGGITRDVLIGTPPATFRDWRYLAAAAGAGLVCFFAGRVLEHAESSIMVFDALGLGLFAVTGATKSLQFGLGPVPAILLGAITGVGGGMLRDVLLRRVPTVLREGLYAVPALLGATVLVVAQHAGRTNPVFPVLGAVVCVVARLSGWRYGINMPTPPGGEHDSRPG